MARPKYKIGQKVIFHPDYKRKRKMIGYIRGWYTNSASAVIYNIAHHAGKLYFEEVYQSSVIGLVKK